MHKTLLIIVLTVVFAIPLGVGAAIFLAEYTEKVDPRIMRMLRLAIKNLAGVPSIVYGLLGLKTHTKLLLIVRRERDGIRRYVHMSTGNYNDVTARLYSDIGFMTSDPDLGADVSDLFNVLTGYSYKQEYRKLLVAPGLMRREIIRRIEREIERHQEHGDGYLAFKMNHLVDKKCIQALYRASQAGVEIDLQVRGICCLRPGIPGLSENISVTSVVGRFLEHPRIFYFRNDGEEEILMGSADLMPRNLDRRIELLFPVESPEEKQKVLRALDAAFRDNVKARVLQKDGSYRRLRARRGEEPYRSQIELHRAARRAAERARVATTVALEPLASPEG